jgi:predicted nuclease with TOPRIM domain
VREVQRQLDSAEAEVSRLKDRLADREVKEEALTSRIKTHEKELVRLQETVFKRDRQLREEQEKTESIQGQIEAIRKGYEAETAEAKAALVKQRQANADLVLQQRREVERLEAEIAEKVPEMIAAAVGQVEARCATKHAKDLAEQRLTYELQRDKLRQELSDMQGVHADKEARQRLQQADERVELEKLRLGSKALQRRNEELEEQLMELRRQLRVATNTSHYLGGTPAGPQRGSGARFNTSGVMGRSMGNWSLHSGPPHQQHQQPQNWAEPHPRESAEFHSVLEQSFDGVRQSREGYPYQSYPSHQGNDENYYHGNAGQGAEEEAAALSHTVSFINDQLAFMKRQISSGLQPREPAAVHSAALSRQHDSGALDNTLISTARTPANLAVDIAMPAGKSCVSASALSNAVTHSIPYTCRAPQLRTVTISAPGSTT